MDTTFTTRDHFIASVEMQISGEPFAEAMGRDLGGLQPGLRLPAQRLLGEHLLRPGAQRRRRGGPNGRIDFPGFASAVESYEYSKQPMNNLAFESGAGDVAGLRTGRSTRAGATGADALRVLRAGSSASAVEADTTARHRDGGRHADNPLGWPGFWPTLQPFTSGTRTSTASNALDRRATISSDDDPARAARSTATTTSATTRRSTCPTARRR